MNKILRYLGVERLGFLEILLAMYPILCGYKYGVINFQIFVFLAIDVYVFIREKGKPRLKQPNKAIFYLALFIIVHETALFFTLSTVPSYFINYYLSFIVLFVSIFIVGPAVNYRKMVGAINLVAVVCIIGLLYQFPIIMSGGVITPISLPFLPALDEGARVYDVLSRPSSFFWEPQSYCSFMFVPLFFALIEKKIIWSIIITISVFLSGSTTGIVISLFMFFYTTVFSSQKLFNKIIVAVITIGLVFLLFNMSFFQVGVNKMESTEYDSNSRLINGIMLVSHMPANDLLFGGNSATVGDYYFSGAASGAVLIEKYDTVYVSTIWMIIVKFGIIGLLFYLWAYAKPILQSKEIAVYVISLFIMLFTNPDYISGIFAFEMIVINCYLINKQKNESIYGYNPLRKQLRGITSVLRSKPLSK